MRKMKNSGIEWVGDIPDNWGVEKTKFNFKYKKEIVGIKCNEFERLALTIKNVVKRPKDDNTGLQPEKFETYQILRKNELVFKLIDLQNVSTSRVGLSPYVGLVSPAYIILRASGKVLPQYAEKYFYTLWKNQIFNSLGDDGVRSNLGKDDLLNILMPVPPIEEQRKIAEFLDEKCGEIDALIADIKTQIESLEQYKRSVITEAVTKGLNHSVEMKDSGIDYIGETPKSWEVLKLKYILSEINIRTVTGTEDLLSVSQYKGVILASENKMRTMQAESLIGYKIVRVDDLIFNKLNPSLARFGCSRYNGITSPDFAVYRSNSILASTKFLEYLLKTERYATQYSRMAGGVGDGFSRLYTNQLFQISVSLPTLCEQQNIVNYIKNKESQIEELKTAKQLQIETLEAYKKSIIYEYVTGKKEVLCVKY